MATGRTNIKQAEAQIRSLQKDIENKAKEAKISGNEFTEGMLHGSIRMKKIKCGKKNCKCADSVEKFGHGPYPHLQWWENGKIKTRYLNKKKYPLYNKILNDQALIKTLEHKIESEREKDEEITKNSKNVD